MVSYERLWKTMEKKGISQYRLINHYKISAGQIGRMKKNMHVSTHTLEVFCNILQCPVEDIVEVILDPQEPAGKAEDRTGGKVAGKTPDGSREGNK
ncbi:MAG: helix-turn-helix transcriptional regulator [Lachnospiraceae bacterium]|nr:helix-turn-helix transcriptional regulator [Lachnospiraceae bacterium]